MDPITNIVVSLVKKYIEPVVKALWQFLKCVVVAAKKLAFPVKDFRTGIKQSRMRYYLVQFTYQNGYSPIVFKEVDSNGQLKRYVDREGNRFLPEEKNTCSVIADGKFQFPQWRKIDCSDIFNGNNNSGCWAITER